MLQVGLGRQARGHNRHAEPPQSYATVEAMLAQPMQNRTTSTHRHFVTHQDLAHLESRLIRWMVGIFVSSVTVVGGLLTILLATVR